MRALQAEQLFLEEAGRGDEADKLQRTIEKLEDQYADFDEDTDDAVVDHDLAELADDEELLEQLGIDPASAQYAPEEGGSTQPGGDAAAGEGDVPEKGDAAEEDTSEGDDTSEGNDTAGDDASEEDSAAGASGDDAAELGNDDDDPSQDAE